MDKELIKRLKDDPHFKEFQEIIISKIDELNFIGDLKNLTDKKAGETVRARAMASEILQDILKPFIDFNEKREPTAKEVDAAKLKVGL